MRGGGDENSDEEKEEEEEDHDYHRGDIKEDDYCLRVGTLEGVVPQEIVATATTMLGVVCARQRESFLCRLDIAYTRILDFHEGSNVFLHCAVCLFVAVCPVCTAD